MLIYAKELKQLGVDFLHVVAGYGFINPIGTPGPFPYEEIKIFCNMTRHLSFKAAVRATLLNIIPPPLARWLGNIGWRYEEGISLGYAATFKREIGLPVIANGGFQHGDFIEAALSEGKCDFVSMARALIANPDLVKHFGAGRDTPNRPCTHCNRCAGRTATSPLGCYEPKRFVSLKAMQDQIMDWNQPDV
jgi:2,4-dienoyl-CoA reductase (NADPH2)